ncbi:MAG: nitroreductase family deazaflavin-dependent oxidoreductase [Candidatus Binatia bacterium]
MNQAPHFIPPGFAARAMNRFYGWLTGLGLGPSHSYLLEVTGRRTGKIRTMPVNVLKYEGKLFLVATRGHTQWSRNVLALQQVTLKRGRVRLEFSLRLIEDAEKPEILKAYLNRFYWMVWRFFPVPRESPAVAFAAIAAHYPVFELIRA